MISENQSFWIFDNKFSIRIVIIEYSKSSNEDKNINMEIQLSLNILPEYSTNLQILKIRLSRYNLNKILNFYYFKNHVMSIIITYNFITYYISYEELFEFKLYKELEFLQNNNNNFDIEFVFVINIINECSALVSAIKQSKITIYSASRIMCYLVYFGKEDERGSSISISFINKFIFPNSKSEYNKFNSAINNKDIFLL
jgi:hypothetical protein